MTWVDRMLGFVGIAPPVAAAYDDDRTRYGSRYYEAGDYGSPHTEGWYEALNDPNQEVLADRAQIVARARSLVRNNPTIAGAIDRLTESVIGARTWLEATPDYEAMGRDADWADTWATNVEAMWRIWANDPMRRCDADGKLLFPEMLRAGYRHWIVDGEACAAIYMIKRGSRYQTAFKMIDPDRLSNPNGGSDFTILRNGNTVVGGCEIAPHGEVVAYHIRKAHPNDPSPDMKSSQWERIARYSKTGRPQFIHAFRQDRAGQRRGVSRLAAAMLRVKMSERYDRAELDAALLNAIFAGFVESPAPTADVRDMMAPGSDAGVDGSYLTELAEYRRKNKVAVRGTQMIHLRPGEKAGFHSAERPSSNYPAFHAAHDRMSAGALGLSYPQYSQDWADINYSSARTLLNETWRGFLEDRQLFTQELGTPVYAALLEEMVALGDVKVPGGPANFYRHKSALVQCEWQGPGRGVIDPLKEAQAADIDMNAGRSNLAIAAADTGRDPRRVLQGLAREKRLREELGLGPFVPIKAMSGANPATDGNGAANGGDNNSGAGADGGQP